MNLINVCLRSDEVETHYIKKTMFVISKAAVLNQIFLKHII